MTYQALAALVPQLRHCITQLGQRRLREQLRSEAAVKRQCNSGGVQLLCLLLLLLLLLLCLQLLVLHWSLLTATT
jgi:hypothetical protein